MPINEKDIFELETLIDAHGFNDVILALSHVCDEKAARARQSFQNEKFIKIWENRAELLTQIHMIPKLIDALDLLIRHVDDWWDGELEQISPAGDCILSAPQGLLKSLGHKTEGIIDYDK